MTKVYVVTLWSKYTNGLSTEEQEPEAELSVKHLKLSIAHYFKACWNRFGMG